ncbi:MAG: hypothetical protein K5669_11315 [Lachnospiraceae bacterium]|nr:hypothetical protein [Lachnospiraceae bacterium]
MAHLAISLDYNFGDKESESITEYFLPYSLDDLAKLELPGKTGEIISYLNSKEQPDDSNLNYPLDSLLYDSLYWITPKRAKIIRTEQPQDYFDDEPDKPRMFRTSLWDMLSDAKLVSFAADSIQEYGLEQKKEINQLADITIGSQLELDYLKTKISILAHLEYALTKETGKIREQRINIRRALDDITFYEETVDSVSNRLVSRFFDNDSINRFFEPVGDYHVEVAEIEREILTYITIIRSESPDDTHLRSYWHYINRLSNRLAKAIRAPFESACETYEIINAVRKNKFYRSTSKSILRLAAFLDERHSKRNPGYLYWEDTTPRETVNCINNDIQSFIVHANAVSSNIYSDGIHLRDIDNLIKNGDVRNKIKANFLNNKKSCFAILITQSGGKHYFSFSGMQKELQLDPNNPDKWGLNDTISYIMKNILHNSSVGNICNQNYKYNYAFIHHNLGVRRYTDILHDTTDYLGKVGPYISQPVTYNIDYANNPTENYGPTYSCCERKMMAYSGYANVQYIFSRWAPCWKCCPAIVDANNPRFFAFTSLDDYKKTKTYNNSEIKEYFVNSNTVYTLDHK